MSNYSKFQRLARYTALPASVMALALSTPALARDKGRHHFNIAAQSAASALQEFARQSGKQVLFAYDAAAGRTTPAIKGDLADDDVLNQLASAAGLAVGSDDGHTITLKPVPNGEASAAAGQDEQLESDVIVTAESLSAMRVPTPIKDIPQSVSVISQKTLEQQNAHDLSDALHYATGITVLQTNSANSDFYSRGFQIAEIHIDGGAPLTLDGNSAVVTTDMSEYNQVGVLRGADGLFGGFGNPGGTIDLERKMPTSTPRASVDLSAGSWNNYRVETDVSGPLALGGKLGGRLVAVYENKDYFYDTAHLERAKVYGVLQYDLDTRTTLSAGGSYERNNEVPALYGVPHFDDGSDADLPRSTALIPPWNRTDINSTELFAKFEHRFGKDWVLKVNATHLRQTNDSKYAYILGTINPVTDLISGASTVSGYTVSRNLLIDATLTGAFYLFGQRQEIILGADHSHLSSSIPLNFYSDYGASFDPFTSNLNDLPEPPDQDILFTAGSSYRRDQLGLMGALRLHPVKGLSLIGGLRDSYLAERQDNQTYYMGSLLFEQELSSHTRGKIVPYGGAVYELSPHYSIYASYADIYNPSIPLMRVNGDRLPSSIDGVNLEAGIKGSWRHDTLNGSLAFFKINQTGLSVSDPTVANPPAADCCFLPEAAHSKGIELELSGKLMQGWWLTAGYTYNENKTVAEGIPGSTILSSQTPKHLFKLWTSYDFQGALKGLSIGGGLTAQSASYVEGEGCPRFDALGQCAAGENPLTPFNITQKSYAVTDLRIAYAFTRNWSLALSLNNLFDKRYYQNIGQNSSGYSDSWYGAPRNFLLKLSASY